MASCIYQVIIFFLNIEREKVMIKNIWFWGFCYDKTSVV